MELRDLAALPGNRLEALRGNRLGEYGIRINDQWRICFVWRGGDGYDVEAVRDKLQDTIERDVHPLPALASNLT